MSPSWNGNAGHRGTTLLGLTLLLARLGLAATAGLSLQPGRLEVEAAPGVQKTASFEIESPPSDDPVRGRLLLSVTDWDLNEDGALQFLDAGTQKTSAARWLTFSPTAISIESGRKYLVRVTVDVPADAAPGVYRAGIFVQERPPAAAPKAGEHKILFRFRYMETVYVVVPPVAADAKLLDAGVEFAGGKMSVVCRLRNEGTGVARPYISWALRNADGIVAQIKSQEGTVLLPNATLAERFSLDRVPPGSYQFSASVDFRDERPVQAITRVIEIAPAASSTSGVSPQQ